MRVRPALDETGGSTNSCRRNPASRRCHAVNGTGSYSDTSKCSDALAREQSKIKRGGSVETDTVLLV